VVVEEAGVEEAGVEEAGVDQPEVRRVTATSCSGTYGSRQQRHFASRCYHRRISWI
jgi:hypothetical protein